MRIVYAVMPPSHANRYVRRLGSSLAAPLGFAETFPPHSVSDRGVTVAAPAVAADAHAISATPQLSNATQPSEPNEFRLRTQTSVVVLCPGLSAASQPVAALRHARSKASVKATGS